jgi:hypothetical protein
MPLHASPSPCPFPLKGARGVDGRHFPIPFESVQIVNA